MALVVPRLSATPLAVSIKGAMKLVAAVTVPVKLAVELIVWPLIVPLVLIVVTPLKALLLRFKPPPIVPPPVMFNPPVPCNEPVPAFTPTAVTAPELATTKLVLWIRLPLNPLPKLIPLIVLLVAAVAFKLRAFKVLAPTLELFVPVTATLTPLTVVAVAPVLALVAVIEWALTVPVVAPELKA